MNKSANLYIRVNPQTKDDAERLFSGFGLTVSDAVNVFLHQSLMVGGFPFEIRKPNQKTIIAMKEAEEIINDTSVKGVNSVEELFKELNS